MVVVIFVIELINKKKIKKKIKSFFVNYLPAANFLSMVKFTII